MKPQDLVAPFLVTDGSRFSLKDHPTGSGSWKQSKKDTRKLLEQGVERLAALQERLYAQDTWGVLLIFQGMDAAGKDSVIAHVMSGVNPQGCQVCSFKTPSAEELDHDFMWRTTKALPERGRIGIFNRSYYEETLVVRVHPEILDRAKLPAAARTKTIWRDRFEDINAFERYLARNGYLIRKFFLHVSKEEQKERFLDRIARPEKNWKFSAADVKERERWDDYMAAYEDTIRHTATLHAPWIVVPSDSKRFARIVVASAIVEALEGLDLAFPTLSPARKRELRICRAALEREGAPPRA
ncbi:MAG TPA: polyphosphate kinase 2 family protein [Vicinamibacterales bacterium]|nr:polyphosphate kinase 2 family protein [Vicinamibacterales bacterium]HPW19288.1 polyphosphate kinase 2 family protein [Vicinamibacterales bacterium]